MPVTEEGVRIAVLEDDQEQSALLNEWLTGAGHVVTVYGDSPQFLRQALRETYDLIMLDWMLPQMSGIEVLKRVRQSGKNYTPVIFITARDSEADVVEALDAGADDYMSKPVRYRELLARVAALARRADGGRPATDLPECAPYEFDTQKKCVRIGGEEVELTHREFDLALFMFRRAGRVVSRGHILESIWGMHGTEINTRTVDTHMSRLRKKLHINEDNGWRLSAIYQHGYRLERTGDA